MLADLQELMKQWREEQEMELLKTATRFLTLYPHILINKSACQLAYLLLFSNITKEIS